MMKTIARDLYLQKLIDRRENGLVKIVTGIRRCGKSFLLFNLFRDYLLADGVSEDRIITLDLEDDLNIGLRQPDRLSEYLHSRIKNSDSVYFVLLDEAPYAVSEEEARSGEAIRLYGILNGLLRLGNVDVYITGSNSRFLSNDVRTEFRGRGDEVRVYPLSFSEFVSAFDGGRDEAWKQYAAYGGLPFILSCKSDEQRASYLEGLFENLYTKDIKERYRIRDERALDRTINILASSIGSLTNPEKLTGEFGRGGSAVSEPTVGAYISYLEDAFLIEKAERYDVKRKAYLDSPFKYYFTDTGLRNVRLSMRRNEGAHVTENIIYNELRIRGYRVDVGAVYTHTTENGAQTVKQTEVDFVCNMSDKRYYIQSAYSIPDEEKLRREKYSMLHTGDNFKKIIVTRDPVRTHYDEDGVLVMNLFDFLLDPDSLRI